MIKSMIPSEIDAFLTNASPCFPDFFLSLWERIEVRACDVKLFPHPSLILTPLQIIILEIMLCETDNKSLLVEDQPYPIPSRIWERLSRPVGERI
jgi:hypothetical protein